MEKYILELLKDNNRVIIPQFGSFIKRPGQQDMLSFNEFLKFDDGLLTDYIVVKKKVSKESAKESIASWVKDVEKAFSEGNTFSLGQMGALQKSSAGKIELVDKSSPQTTTPAAKETPKEEPIKQEEKKPEAKKEEKKPEPPIEEKKPTPPKEEKKTEPEKKPEPKFTPKPTTPPEKKIVTETKTTSTTSPKTTTSSTPPPKSPPPKTTTTQPPTTTKTTTPPSKTTTTTSAGSGTGDSKKGKTGIFVIIAVAAVLVGAVVTGFVLREKIFPGKFGNDKKVALVSKNKKNSKDETKDSSKKESEKETKKNKKDSKDKPKTDKKSTIKKDEKVAEKKTTEKKDTEKEETAKKEVEKKETVKKEPEKKKTTPQANPDNRYYIVAGCFREKWRAEKYTKTLHDKGFTNARIFGMEGDFHTICYDSYPTQQKALNELAKIKNTHQMRGWIKYQ